MVNQPEKTPLSVAEMWRAWPDPTKPSGETETESEEALQARLDKLSLDVPIPPAIGDRINHSPTSPRTLAAQQALRTTKLAIYADVLSFYHQEAGERRMLIKRWEELHGPEVEGYSLELRLRRANVGKDVANRKYTKEKNWFGAMYTYAIAWGCLLPYYPEALPRGDQQLEMGKFEGATWSNLAASIITGSEGDAVPKSQRAGMIQLGLRAALVCMAMSEYVTVGVIQKACDRAVRLRGMLKPDEHQTGDDEAASWSRQGQLLNGIEGKMLFRDVEEAKRVIRPRVGDLQAVQIL